MLWLWSHSKVQSLSFYAKVKNFGITRRWKSWNPLKKVFTNMIIFLSSTMMKKDNYNAFLGLDKGHFINGKFSVTK